MVHSTKSAINTINEISRQLLSLFDANIEISNSDNDQGAVESNSPITANNGQLSDDKLASVVAKRHELINLLFEKYTREELSRDLELINEMILIDQELVEKSQTSKNLLSEQVIKLRNSKKIRKIYNKY